MQLKRNAVKTQPSQNKALAEVLDEIKPIASTTRRLRFVRGRGISRAELKRGFADDINDMFRR